jgi:hypothetical protein
VLISPSLAPKLQCRFAPVFGLTDVQSSTADLSFRHGAILACSFGIEVLKRANTRSEKKEEIFGQFLHSFAYGAGSSTRELNKSFRFSPLRYVFPAIVGP